MALKIDLRTTYASKLNSRGISSSDADVYERVLDELAGFLSQRDPSDWRPADLDVFMKSKSPNLGPTERPVYGAALSILLEILDKAALKGAELSFERKQRPDSRAKAVSRPKEIKGLPGAMPSMRRAKKLDSSEVSGRAASSGVMLVSSQSGAGSKADHSSNDAGDERKFKLRPITHPGRSNALPFADTVTPHAAITSPAYVLSDPDQRFEGPRRKRRGFDPKALVLDIPDMSEFEVEPARSAEISDFGLESHRVESDGIGGFDGQSSYFIDEPVLDVPTPSFDSVPDEAFSSDAAVGPALSGVVSNWKSSSKITKVNSGLLVADRYEVPEKFDLSGLSSWEIKTTSISEQFFQQHRLAPIVILVALFGSTVMFFVQPLVASLLMLGSLVGLGLFVAVFVTALKLSKKPTTVESSQDAVVGYVSAIRTGNFGRAKVFMAHPGDCKPLTIQELLDTNRGPLGTRFNIASPKALAMYWAKHIPNLDRSEGGRLGQTLSRYFKPEDIDCDLLMRSEEGEVEVVVLRGRELDDYAIVPVVKIGERWLVADGECVLNSSRVEALSRISRRHLEKAINNETLVRLIGKFNLTRTDISRALLAGALTEEQAQLLVQKSTPPS